MPDLPGYYMPHCTGVIPDDSAIVGYTTMKTYADHHPTGARITIKETT